jgi:hypothetical protein
MTEKAFPDGAVYTPADVSYYTQEWIENLEKNKERAVGFAVSAMADYVAPLMPGQLCAVIAQTSHYKSGFLHSWERRLAYQLMAAERVDECIVHVSVEESVEEQGILMLSVESGEDTQELARGLVKDWTKLKAAAIKIGTVPIYRVGDALARPEDMPNLYLSNIIKAIKFLVDKWNLKVAAIFVDYLQALPFDPEHRIPGNDQRRLQVRDDIYRLRQATHIFGCPIIVAVQAKQHLDGAPSDQFYIPGPYDGNESADIAQRCDRIITLWLPKQTCPVGTEIEYKGMKFKVDENLLFIRVAKQRGRLPSGRVYKCRIDFQANTIAPESSLGDEDKGGRM